MDTMWWQTVQIYITGFILKSLQLGLPNWEFCDGLKYWTLSLLPLLFGPWCNKQSLVFYSCSEVSNLLGFHSHRWRMELACGDMRTWGIHAGCPTLTKKTRILVKVNRNSKSKYNVIKTRWLQHGSDGTISVLCICDRWVMK